MKKILVIEDEQVVRLNILKMLRSEGFEVLAAENGAVGVELAQSHLPDLVICDILMPELDGYGVLTALRQNSVTASVPFIFLTARAEHSDLRLGMNLGADDYLTKPFTRAELLGAITSRLKKSGTIEQFQSKIQELQQLSLLKDELIGTVTHDLRAPLANIQIILQMLPQLPSDEQRQRYMQILQAECSRELNLLNDLLDLQRLESSQVDLPSEAIDLSLWIPNIVELFQVRVSDRQQRLVVHLNPNLPTLETNPEGISRVLQELLNNACKYTQPGGEIILRVSCELPAEVNDTAVIVFSVVNQAEIPAEALPHIFDKFYRVPKGDPWKQGGTGLGLSLVKQLVQRLHGTIHLTSESGWTEFTVCLPERERRDEG
jgi:signal transduction histidine kinase